MTATFCEPPDPVPRDPVTGAGGVVEHQRQGDRAYVLELTDETDFRIGALQQLLQIYQAT